MIIYYTFSNLVNVNNIFIDKNLIQNNNSKLEIKKENIYSS